VQSEVTAVLLEVAVITSGTVMTLQITVHCVSGSTVLCHCQVCRFLWTNRWRRRRQ